MGASGVLVPPSSPTLRGERSRLEGYALERVRFSLLFSLYYSESIDHGLGVGGTPQKTLRRHRRCPGANAAGDGCGDVLGRRLETDQLRWPPFYQTDGLHGGR